jgi:Uma2 family endonuclease
MQLQEREYYSPTEYLDLEVAAEERHEYIDGLIIPMTGGLPNHNQICLNLAGKLNYDLKKQPYRVFITDQRLSIPLKRIYTYPDIMIVRGEIQLEVGRKDTVTNPLVIAEVLSQSTSNYDRVEKFAAYRTIPSFQEYLLIDQHTVHVERYFKSEANKWIFSETDNLEDTIELESLLFEISLTEVYDKVDFETEG